MYHLLHSIILKYSSRANTYRTKYHPDSRFSILHLKKHWAFITKTDFTFRLGKYLKRKPTRSSPMTSYETKLRKTEWKFQNILSEMKKSKVREVGEVEFPFTDWRGIRNSAQRSLSKCTAFTISVTFTHSSITFHGLML